MAKPLSTDTLASLSMAPGKLSPVQICNLAVQGLITTEGDKIVHTSKAGRAMKRMAKAAELEGVKVKVHEALTQIGTDAEKMFRLDDVLKATGLDKSEYRGLILDSLRSFRDEGLTESIKLSDNNFQIFWKVTPEFLQS